MATRELTKSFLQLRADAKAKSLRRKNIVNHSEEGNALMKNGDSSVAHVLNIAPGWVDVVGETNQYVARIKEMSTLPLANLLMGKGGMSVIFLYLTMRMYECSGQAEQAAHEEADGAL